LPPTPIHGICVRSLKLTIQLEQETDGRWIAEVPKLPGVLAYGDTEEKAAQLARALAFRVLADPPLVGAGGPRLGRCQHRFARAVACS
jgi:predicted RNase H-like HicB family nuclease